MADEWFDLRILSILNPDGSVSSTTERIPVSEEEQARRLVRMRAERLQEMRAMKHRCRVAGPWNCDMCGKPLGYAYDGDLNGSYFFCKECKEKNSVEDSSSST